MSFNGFNGMNGGGGDNTQTLLIVGACVCCCLVCVVAGVVLYWTGMWESLKTMFGFVGDDGEATPDPENENDDDDDDDNTNTNTNTNTNSNTNSNTNTTSGGAYLPRGCDRAKFQRNRHDKSCSTGSDGNMYVCSVPWERPFVVFDKNGRNPRCCSSPTGGTCNKYGSEALWVPGGWDYNLYHQRIVGTNRNPGFRGKINGKIFLGTCPGKINGKHQPDSLIFHERDASGNTVRVHCMPRVSQNGYKINERYVFNVRCPGRNNKPKDYASACTNGGKVTFAEVKRAKTF